MNLLQGALEHTDEERKRRFAGGDSEAFVVVTHEVERSRWP